MSIQEMIRKLIFVVFASLLISLPTVAAAEEPPLDEGEERWNRFPSQVIRQQSAGLPNERCQNGGVGDGANEAHFCSTQDEAGGGGEAYYYYSTADWEVLQDQEANKGEYNFVMIENRCQTEGGCGDIQPDGKCIAVGIPTHAMNCHSLGRRMAVEPVGGLMPGDWEGRNSIDDEYGFLYGRYLINEIDCPYQDPTAEPLCPLMSVSVPRGVREQYDPVFAYNAWFIDIPYNLPTLRWFACGGIDRLDGYKANPLWQAFPFPRRETSSGLYSSSASPVEGDLDNWTKDHYKTRLAMAVNRLGREISGGDFGSGYRGSPGGTLDTETRETVVTPWNALKKMINRIPGGCSNQDCSRLWHAINWFMGTTVAIRYCETARGSIVEYQPDEERICISPEIRSDCRAQWDKGVVSMPDDLPCISPLGRRDGVLYESLYGHGTSRGYELFIAPDSSGSERLQAREGGRVRSEGYSSIMVALLAHALIEAECHQRTGRNCLEGWPGSPEASRIEEIARLGQSLVYYELCSLGLCPLSFEMKETDYVHAITRVAAGPNAGRIGAAFRGRRYFYESECRGPRGINLNPLCLDMLNIANQLLRQRPVVAKTMAIWMSSAPITDWPPLQTVNGVEGPFVRPQQVGPPGTLREVIEEFLPERDRERVRELIFEEGGKGDVPEEGKGKEKQKK